jgi:Outer membrane protein beta-barrel domain
MSSARWLLSARRTAVFAAVSLLATGAACAQVAASVAGPDNSSREATVSTYSSSSDSTMFGDSGGAADPSGIPGAPTPAKGGGGGQYDNSAGKASHDWKSRIAVEAGAGFNVPTSDTSSDLNTGYNFTVGGGLHFSHGVALLAEYQFMNDGLPSSIVAEAGANSGNAHIWSLTLDPVVDLMPKKATSVYVTGGGGFYRKVTNFSNPQPVQYCTYFYCGVGYQNQVVGHFSSNQGGWNVGGGVTHRFGGMYNEGRMEVFGEVRYLDIMTPAVTTAPNGLGVTSVGADTKLIPITFGVRF